MTPAPSPQMTDGPLLFFLAIGFGVFILLLIILTTELSRKARKRLDEMRALDPFKPDAPK